MHKNYLCPITGREIISYLDEGYSGACRLQYKDRKGKRDSAIFLSVKEAERAARWAIQQNKGGYIQASLYPTTAKFEYSKAESWLFST